MRVFLELESPKKKKKRKKLVLRFRNSREEMRNGSRSESRETKPRSEVQETAFNTISARASGPDEGPWGRRGRRTHARGAEFPAGVAERERTSEKGRERVGR